MNTSLCTFALRRNVLFIAAAILLADSAEDATANIDGPEPDSVQPYAPESNAARCTSWKPFTNTARCGSITASSVHVPTSEALPCNNPATIPPTFPHCLTAERSGIFRGNKTGHAASSVMTFAKDLKRPLLLINGTADDNVYFMHSLKLSGELFKSGRDFDFLPLAGFTHMVPDPRVTINLEEKMLRFLGLLLKPESR